MSQLAQVASSPPVASLPPPPRQSPSTELLVRDLDSKSSNLGIADKVKEVEKTLRLIGPNIHLLDRKSFDVWKQFLEESAGELKTSLINKDAEAFSQKLDKLLKKFSSLNLKYLDIERKQGLIAVHVDTGVRIYYNKHEKKAWLCTPSSQLPTDGAALIAEATGLTHDPAKAKTLEGDKESHGAKTLACRLDELVLNPGVEEFTVKLKLHSEIVELKFSQEDLRSVISDPRRGFGYGAGEWPNFMHLLDTGSLPWLGQDPAGTLKQRQQTERQRGSHLPQVPVRAVLPRVPAKPPVPLPPPASPHLKPITERVALRPTNLASLTPDEASKLRETLAKSQKQFDDVVSARRIELEGKKGRLWNTNGVIQQAKGNTEEYNGVVKAIHELDETVAKDVLLRKNLLEHQLAQVSDEVAKGSIRRELVSMARNVDDAYDTLLKNLAPSSTEHADYIGARAQFKADIAQHAKTIGNPVTRTIGRVWNSLSEAATKHRSLPFVKSIGEATENWWRVKPALASIDKIDTALTQTVSSLDDAAVAKSLAQMDQFADRLKAGIKVLDERIRHGGTVAINELDKLKTADAQITVRKVTLLERRLSDKYYPQRAQDLEALESLKSDADAAYKKLGQAEEASDFAARQQSRSAEISRNREVVKSAEHQAKKIVTPTDQAMAKLMEHEPSLKQATELKRSALSQLDEGRRQGKIAANSPKEIALKSACQLAEAQENLILHELKLEELEGKLATETDPIKRTTIETDIKNAQTDLKNCRTTQSFHEQNYREKKIGSLKADVNELKNTSNPPTQIEHQRKIAKLQQEIVTVTAELEEINGVGNARFIKDELSELRKQIGLKKAELRSLSGLPADNTAGEIAKLEQRVLRKTCELIDHELDGVNKAKQALTDGINNIDPKLDDATKQRVIKTLKGKIKGLETSAEFLSENRKIADCSYRKALAERVHAELKAKVTALGNKPSLSSVEAAEHAQLQKKLDNAAKGMTKVAAELKEAQVKFQPTWSKRLSDMAKTFDQKVMAKAAELAEKHPIRGAMFVAAVGESMRAVFECSKDPDAKHTVVPGLLAFLDGDLDDGFFGIPEHYIQWQGKDLGGGTRRAVNFFGHGANATLVVGGVIGVVKIGSLGYQLTAGKTAAGAAFGQKAGTVLASQTAGRLLTGVGGAADGFLTFQDFESWARADTEQLLSKTGSPMAIAGGTGLLFFGPLGAGLGVLGAAFGEIAGVTYAVNKLNQEIKNDWRKKGVLESIALGERGFVYSDDVPVLKTRLKESLQEHEIEAVTDLSRIRTLGRVFTTRTEEDKEKQGFTVEELQQMGFKFPRDGASEKEKEKLQQHNYQRFLALLETPFYRYVGLSLPTNENSWAIVPGTLNDSQRLSWSHPELYQRFMDVANEDREYYEDLYRRAPRVTHEMTKGEVSALGVMGRSAARNTTWLLTASFTASIVDIGDGAQPQFEIESKNEFEGLMSEAVIHFKNSTARLGSGKSPPELAAEQWEILAEKFPRLGQILSHPLSRQSFFLLFNAEWNKDQLVADPDPKRAGEFIKATPEQWKNKLELQPFWTHKVLAPSGTLAQQFVEKMPAEERRAEVQKVLAVIAKEHKISETIASLQQDFTLGE